MTPTALRKSTTLSTLLARHPVKPNSAKRGNDQPFRQLLTEWGRLVNAASLMIAYVSLIPIISESLPPMPGITLVEIIAYTLTVPIFLAIISSLLSYNQTIQQWRLTYHAF